MKVVLKSGKPSILLFSTTAGPSSYPRRSRGAKVNVLACKITSLGEYHRLFGSKAKTKHINGVIEKVFAERFLSGRARASLKELWSLQRGSKMAIVKLILVKAGHLSEGGSKGNIANDDNQLFQKATIERSYFAAAHDTV